jgi:uncharacterized membrane protein YhaH (DUF805 family)
MRHPLDLFSWKGRVTRWQYLLAGFLLFVVKCGIDGFVCTRFGQTWNPLMYVSLRISPLFAHEALPNGYVATLLAVAVPFVWAGVSLSARRLRDAGVHPFWAGLFFFPLLHYAFFLLLLVIPSQKDAVVEGGVLPSERDPYRGSDPRYPTPKIQSWLARITPMNEARAAILGIGLSSAMALGCYALTTRKFLGLGGNLGLGLFVGLPFAMGFVTSFCAALGGRIGIARSMVYALVTEAIGVIMLMALAWEGIACIIMALPIFTGLILLGAGLGWVCAGSPTGAVAPAALSSFALFPLIIALDGQRAPAPASLSVVSEVTIAAPPDVVWKNVVSFPPIDEPPEAIFAIVAMPIEAKIDGSDPGATRRCIFTNGTFVEPIETWRAPEELTFRVKEQPGNLDRYLDVTRGQFLLIDNHDGTTTLRGTTWYQLKVFPTAYWKAWADLFLHRIHLRVLRHVKKLSEHPDAPVGVAAQMPAWMQQASHTCKCTTVSSAKTTTQ